MKICPKCNAQYEHEMTFCLRDGERLVFSDSNSKETQAMENKPPQLNEKSAYVPQFENNIDRPKLRINSVIGIILGVIATFLIVSFGLGYLAPPQDETGTNSNQSANQPNSSEDVEDVNPAMKEINEDYYDGLKIQLVTASKDYYGLKPLASTSVPKDSLEIRFYLIPGFYGPIYKGVSVENSILILKRDNSNWSGTIIRNIIKSNSAKEKVTETLNPPASGWDGLWQKLQAAGVLEPPTKSETQVKTSSALYVIESKDGGKYTYSYFHVPREKSTIEEERRIATVFNLLAQEFNAGDLKAS